MRRGCTLPSRISALRTLVAIAVVAAGMAAGASPAAATGTIFVTPTTGLADGRVVSVSGSGWEPGGRIEYCQGVAIDFPNQGSSNCASGRPLVTHADANGNLSVSLTIARWIDVPSAGGFVDCAAPGASCVAAAGDIVNMRDSWVWEQLHFAPVPPLIVPSLRPLGVLEGDSGTTSLTVPVTLSFAPTNTATVEWTTLDNPACPNPQRPADPATDYTPASGTMTFAPGDTNEAVTITVNGDTLFEPDECVNVSFTNPTNATFITGSSLVSAGTIFNDDRKLVIQPGFASMLEGDTGTTALHVPVALSEPSANPVTVQWVTYVNAGPPPCQPDPTTDYTPASGTVTFAPGDTSEAVTISVNGDTLIEPDECVIVSFRNATNAVIGGFYGLGVGTITNDDSS